MSVEEFVEYISNMTPPTADSCNLYAGDDALSRLRRSNLSVYLSEMQCLRPEVMLVGEAPGVHGCYLTGIPFTAEWNIRNNSFFANRGYGIYSEEPHAEASASVIWSMLEHKHQLPLMWNIYPFHPHLAGKPMTNRTPTKQEIRCGIDVLMALQTVFPGLRMYGVGRKAADSMTIGYIRHPARGGSKVCAEMLNAILQ